MKYRALAVFVAICVMIAGVASPAKANAALQNRAKEFVMNVIDETLVVLKNGANEDEKQKKLEALFRTHVDSDWMGKFVMGKYYRTLTETQKVTYHGLYKEYLMQTYVPKFKNVDVKDVVLDKVVANEDNQFSMQTSVKTGTNQNPLLVHYRVRYDAGADTFKVIDFSGEGISLITTQRSDFSGLIGREGVDKFLTKLAAQVDRLKKKAA